MTSIPLHLGVRGSKLYATVLPLALRWIAALSVSCERDGESPKPASAPGAESTHAAAPGSEQDWCDVLAADPDPAVVTDADGRARMTATGLPWKVRDRKSGIVMLLCPPGEFMMGSPASESGWRRNTERRQRVSITQAFYMSETEVTQGQWQRTMGANPSHFKGASNPVEMVSWHDIQVFCRWTGLRLPSEAEWEYACRAGTTGAYAGELDSMGWYSQNSGATPHPVAQKRPNPWGLYDMHGNVWEWCEDGYARRAAGTQQAAPASESRMDGYARRAAGTQQAAPASECRMLRGGSWNDGANSVRSSARGLSAPDSAYFSIGFRVARAPH